MTFEDELNDYYIPGKLYQHHRYRYVLEFSNIVYRECSGCKSELGICKGQQIKFTNGRTYCPSDSGYRRFIKVKVSNVRW